MKDMKFASNMTEVRYINPYTDFGFKKIVSATKSNFLTWPTSMCSTTS